jgi:hypothetical protein
VYLTPKKEKKFYSIECDIGITYTKTKKSAQCTGLILFSGGDADIKEKQVAD